jgi:glycine cleavage system H protein
MESSRPSNKYPLVPPAEQKCVWMTAGILSYQLCERQFDCDHCPLDSALRAFPQHPAADVAQDEAREGPKETARLVPGYLYSRKHCWIRSTDGTTVRIGIEPRFSSLLRNARTVVLPSVGDRVQMNKACAWIVLEGGTLPIGAPLDAEVSRTNASLVDRPFDIHDDPFEKGWLFEVTTNEDIFNLSSLYRVAEADRIYAEDERRFQSLVSADLKKHRVTAGATLADGGQPVPNVAEMLGGERYFLLLREVFT